jgi:hypothetical protein
MEPGAKFIFLATEAHGKTRKNKGLKRFFPCNSVCFRGYKKNLPQ